MNPKISIIVPVYKVEKYISATIDSLLNQNYDNFEVILVDDGSPDRAGDICNEYATRDNRVIVYHKENGGVTSARKMGVEKSTGEWIVFVDGDDLLTPDALTSWYQLAKENDADYILTPMICCSDTTQHLSKMRISGLYSSEQFCFLLCNEYASYGIGGRMIAKRLFDENTFSAPSEIINNEDLFMNLHLTEKMKNMYAYSRKGFYKYISRVDSASHSKVPETSWTAAYNEALRQIPVYGDCMGMYILLSIYHRIFFHTVSFQYAQSWISQLHNVQSYPLRLKVLLNYIMRPSKLKYIRIRIILKILDLMPVSCWLY